MKRLLHILLFLLIASVSNGQIIGLTSYSLENAIIPSGNTEAIITVDDANALTFDRATGNVITQNGSHGAIMSNGNTISMNVSNSASITFSLCKYSATGATFSFTDTGGNDLGSIRAESKTTDIDEEEITFSFKGTAQTIKATLNAAGSVYLHTIAIENFESLPSLGGKTQVWDFGAEQLVGDEYINVLDVATINAWYAPEIVEGSNGNTLPNFTEDVLSWLGNPTSDRLRTTNLDLTRKDENISGDYAGRVYANGTVAKDATTGLATNRFFRMELSEDDEVTVVASSQNGTGQLTFVYEDDADKQMDQSALTTSPAVYGFIARQDGNYLIYDAIDKGSYYRFYRSNAEFVTISGAVNEDAAASIPEGYALVFTNTMTGKAWENVVSSQSYSVDLPAGHTYDLSLKNANGYVITSTNSIDVTVAATVDVTVAQIDLFTVSGTISGLGADINNLGLTYTPDPAQNKVYVPEVSVDAGAGSYEVILEPNCEYTITALGVNDYTLGSTSITITGDETSNLTFTAKSVYDITITTTGLTEEQKGVLQVTFTNLNEQGYVYHFAATGAIQLRDAVYSVSTSGIDAYAVEMTLTSNLVVSGTATTKNLQFEQVNEWSFDDKAITGTSYKGLLFSGTGAISSELAKGHLTGKNGAIIAVPAAVGQKMIVSYYYNADFSIDGGTAYTTTSGSTSTIETAEYAYPGVTDGTINITIGASVSTTYITNIVVFDVIPYTATVTVGTDKEYQTINEALEAVRLMTRTGEQRVNVVIDPGNYEEMLVIDVDNVTFTNAAASPSIALKDAGVNIDENAVRITSYYGHGYSYYSMDNDQKWHADVLAVNKENGYLSYVNKGSGTGNGSFWNATVAVFADGFEANHIIFENSFNQYVSAKEADDVVVEWEDGGKGTRPTDLGNTGVQNKSFVERAAAIAIEGGDKIILNKCRVVGHQDSFYGGKNSRVVVYKGNMMGGTDYLFGGMIAVFYKTDLALTTSTDGNDIAYITAAQQTSGRGYLMYECNITSAIPTVEVANTLRSKPGFFGRPWEANTSEVVFYNTNIETSNATGFEGKSLIDPLGWKSTLSGESAFMYEYNTTEVSGADNSGLRVSWATQLASPQLSDGTAITTFNFTKGSDNWDPIPDLINDDVSTAIRDISPQNSVKVYGYNNTIYVSNVEVPTKIDVYSFQGSLVNSFVTNSATNFPLENGSWIVNVTTKNGRKAVKVIL